MTIATYASRFDDFSGEQFDVSQTVDQPNGDKIVKTQIVQSTGKTVALNYLMRMRRNLKSFSNLPGPDLSWRIRVDEPRIPMA